MEALVRGEVFIVHKDLNFNYTYCNNIFLQYAGLKSIDQALGCTDLDMCWSEYADLYETFELDLLAGKQYSSLAPLKDYKGEEKWFFGNKFLKYNEKSELIGSETYIMEIVQPKFFSLINFLKSVNEENKIQTYKIGHLIDDIKLTTREGECLFYILKAKSAKEIARLLNLSNRTIETYIEHLKFKFGAESKSDLIIKAIEKGYMKFIPKNICKKLIDE